VSGFDFGSLDDSGSTSGPSGRRVLLVAVVLFVAGILVVAIALASPIKRLLGDGGGDYQGDGTGSVEVVVHPGDSASTIGSTLARAGVRRLSARPR
jgi:UPF0755 protein